MGRESVTGGHPERGCDTEIQTAVGETLPEPAAVQLDSREHLTTLKGRPTLLPASFRFVFSALWSFAFSTQRQQHLNHLSRKSQTGKTDADTHFDQKKIFPI